MTLAALEPAQLANGTQRSPTATLPLAGHSFEVFIILYGTLIRRVEEVQSRIACAKGPDGKAALSRLRNAPCSSAGVARQRGERARPEGVGPLAAESPKRNGPATAACLALRIPPRHPPSLLRPGALRLGRRYRRRYGTLSTKRTPATRHRSPRRPFGRAEVNWSLVG